MTTPRILTVKQFAEQIGKPAGWPSEGALRRLIFHAATNGIGVAIRRPGGGRRIMIDVAAFERWATETAKTKTRRTARAAS